MENYEELIQEVKHFIGANRTEKALELLAKAQLSDLDKDLIILNSRYSKVKEDQRLGVIDDDLAQRRLNTINRDLLELSEKIGKNPIRTASSTYSSNEKVFNKWLIIVPVSILLLASVIFFLSKSNYFQASDLKQPVDQKVTKENDREKSGITVINTPKSNSNPTVPVTPVFLKNSINDLSLNANGGAKHGAEMILHPCEQAYYNCLWVFELSPDDSGAYYIKSKGSELYLNANGGANHGANIILHPCSKDNDFSNCQWILVHPKNASDDSLEYYIKSKGTELYLAIEGKIRHGSRIKLNNSPPDDGDDSKYRWRLIKQ